MKSLSFAWVAGFAAAAAAAPASAADISGAGATFPFPVYAKWAEAYNKETGTRMGVCESRVSQIHSSAVALLKARMKEVLIAQQREEESARKQPWAKPATILPAPSEQHLQRTAQRPPASTLSDITTSVQRRHRAGRQSGKLKKLPRTAFTGAGKKA